MSTAPKTVRVETILVGKLSSSLNATNPFNPAGTAKVNNTAAPITVNNNTFQPGEVMLETGQLGIYAYKGSGSRAKHAHIDSTDTATTAPSIVITQKRDTSNDREPLPPRPINESRPIDSNANITFAGLVCADPTNDTWLIGNGTGNADSVNVTSNVTYKLSIKYDGRKTDILNGRNQPADYPEYQAGDLSALTTVDGRDLILQNLAFSVNELSLLGTPGGSQTLAFALNEAAAGTAPSAVTIAGLTAGTVIAMVIPSTGTTWNHTLTASEVASLQSLIVAGGGPLANTTVIETIDLTTAGTGAANVDHIALVVTDDKRAYYDRIPEDKPSIDVGLLEGFNSNVYNTELVFPYEGEGLGRQLRLYYESTDGLRRFDTLQLDGLDGKAIHYDIPIDDSKRYAVYTITHGMKDQATDGLPSESPLATVVLLECCDEDYKDDFEAIMNAWLASISHGVEFYGETAAGGIVVPNC